MINAGKLRHRIAIQRKTVEKNTYGEEVVVFVDRIQTWASIEPLSGREYYQANQTQSSVDHRISMRYQSGIQTYDRVKFKSGETVRYFDILSVINLEERNITLELMCKEFTSP